MCVHCGTKKNDTEKGSFYSGRKISSKSVCGVFVWLLLSVTLAHDSVPAVIQ